MSGWMWVPRWARTWSSVSCFEPWRPARTLPAAGASRRDTYRHRPHRSVCLPARLVSAGLGRSRPVSWVVTCTRALIDMSSHASHAQESLPRRFKIVICRGPECGDRHGSAALHDAFRAILQAHGAQEHTELVWQSCFGRCTQGPNVLVREILTQEPATKFGSGLATLPGPRGATALYNRVDTQRVEHVVADHVIGGQIVRAYVERPGIHPNDPVSARTKDS
jgi:(2Fe-2S) ferredoxin